MIMYYQSSKQFGTHTTKERLHILVAVSWSHWDEKWTQSHLSTSSVWISVYQRRNDTLPSEITCAILPWLVRRCSQVTRLQALVSLDAANTKWQHHERHVLYASSVGCGRLAFAIAFEEGIPSTKYLICTLSSSLPQDLNNIILLFEYSGVVVLRATQGAICL